jgi:hypothetical protein
MIQNVRIVHPNFIRVGSYFYTFDHQSDNMIQKADDGTVAFAYPLDVPLTNQIKSLDFDGESFWTLEWINDSDADAGFRIKRWVIQDFLMFLQQTFTFASNATDIFESSAFAIEKYQGTVVANGAENLATVQVTFDGSPDIFALLTPGTPLFLGPSTKSGFAGQSQRVLVNSTSAPNIVTLTAPKTVGFNPGDQVTFSKNIWVFNQHYLQQTSVGGLYKINAQDGSILQRDGPSGTYLGINSAIFHNVQSFESGSPLFGFNGYYLLFIRTASLLFIDVLDSNLTVALSAVQNVIGTDSITIFPVFDLGAEDNTLFRLQTSFNIGGTQSTESTHNYQLATFRPFPTAIALTAVEPLLPAGAGVATAIVTATVTDQYAQPFVTVPASTITFSTTGGGTGSGLSNTSPIALNSNGQASVTYTSGATVGLVTINAVVTIA